MSAQTAASLHIAYADPPYIGKAAKYYRHEPSYAGEVNHDALLARLVSEYPDGWALSCSSPSLRLLLPLCPNDVRVLSWCKPWVPFKKGVGVAYAWEPILVRGGRPRTRADGTVLDWLRTPQTMQRGLVGVKPDMFCFWLFNVLNLQPGDVLDDLFPGSGAVSAAWNHYQHQVWNTG